MSAATNCWEGILVERGADRGEDNGVGEVDRLLILLFTGGDNVEPTK